jgi:hypothetical protein
LVRSLEKTFETTLARSKQRIEQLAQQAETGMPMHVPDQGLEPISCVEASRDGQWLACGTSDGVRLFTWGEILSADESPTPHSYATSPPIKYPGDIPLEAASTTRALAFAPGRLLFAGMEGVIRYLDLDSGANGILLDAPRRHLIEQLALSGDCHTFACICRPFDPATQFQSALQIWNYEALSDKLSPP